MWFEARASINSGSQIEFDGRDLQNIYILGPKGIKLKDDQVILFLPVVFVEPDSSLIKRRTGKMGMRPTF